MTKNCGVVPFEIYCQNLMTAGDVKKFYDYKFHNGDDLQEIVPGVLNLAVLQLGKCTRIKETTESLIAAAKKEENENVVFHSSDRQYKLFDFLYRKGKTFYAFQVFIGQRHLFTPTLLMEAMEEVGKDHEFLLHYLTFDKRYKEFQLDPVNPFNNNNNGIHIKSPLTNNWTIKVICVPSPDEEDHRGRSKHHLYYR